jgi:hypothetical protein
LSRDLVLVIIRVILRVIICVIILVLVALVLLVPSESIAHVQVEAIERIAVVVVAPSEW